MCAPVLDHRNAGVTNDFHCTEYPPKVDYFLTFFSQDRCQLICDEANHYHNLCEEMGALAASA